MATLKEDKPLPDKVAGGIDQINHLTWNTALDTISSAESRENYSWRNSWEFSRNSEKETLYKECYWMEEKGENYKQVKFSLLVLLNPIYIYGDSGNFHSKRKGKLALDV